LKPETGASFMLFRWKTASCRCCYMLFSCCFHAVFMLLLNNSMKRRQAHEKQAGFSTENPT
jgi:hypothetical protein